MPGRGARTRTRGWPPWRCDTPARPGAGGRWARPVLAQDIFLTLVVLAVASLFVQGVSTSVVVGAVSLVLSVAVLAVIVIARRYIAPITRIELVNGLALAVPEASEVTSSDPAVCSRSGGGPGD